MTTNPFTPKEELALFKKLQNLNTPKDKTTLQHIEDHAAKFEGDLKKYHINKSDEHSPLLSQEMQGLLLAAFYEQLDSSYTSALLDQKGKIRQSIYVNVSIPSVLYEALLDRPEMKAYAGDHHAAAMRLVGSVIKRCSDTVKDLSGFTAYVHAELLGTSAAKAKAGNFSRTP